MPCRLGFTFSNSSGEMEIAPADFVRVSSGCCCIPSEYCSSVAMVRRVSYHRYGTTQRNTLWIQLGRKELGCRKRTSLMESGRMTSRQWLDHASRQPGLPSRSGAVWLASIVQSANDGVAGAGYGYMYLHGSCLIQVRVHLCRRTTWGPRTLREYALPLLR